MTDAYKAVLGTEEEQMLEELLLKYINKPDSTACCVALRYSHHYLVPWYLASIHLRPDELYNFSGVSFGYFVRYI